MKKKILIPILILPFMILLSNIVRGQTNKLGLDEIFRQLIGPLLGLVGEVINMVFSFNIQADLFISYARFALFIMALAIVMTILGTMDMFQYRKGLSFIVGIVVSFLAVIAIPTNVFWAIAGTYSTLYASVLIYAPLVGMWYLVAYKWKAYTKGAYFLKAGFMLVLFFVMWSVVGYLMEGGPMYRPEKGTPVPLVTGFDFGEPMGMLMGIGLLVTLGSAVFLFVRGFTTSEWYLKRKRAERIARIAAGKTKKATETKLMEEIAGDKDIVPGEQAK